MLFLGRSFWMKKTVLLIIIFVGVLVFAVGYSDSQYRTALGRDVPSLWLPDGEDGVTLDDMRGNYVLLNFWKSTDAPSRRSANDYTAWLRRHPGANVRLVSVNLDDNPEMYREIVRLDSLIPSTQFHVDGDTARAVYNSFGLDEGLGTMLVGTDGKIMAHNPSWDVLNGIIKAGR